VADHRLQLARGWLKAGRAEQAIASCRAFLAQHPADLSATLVLADAYREQGRLETALEMYDTLLQHYPHHQDILISRERCRQQLAQPLAPASFESHPDGRVCLHDQARFPTHRSGWNFAIDALRAVHRDDGVRLDGFVEDTFSWRVEALEAEGVLPRSQPWVGFVHNPVCMPAWYHPDSHPQMVLSRPSCQRSMQHCRGLFTLSEELAGWVRHETGKPVSTLLLPTGPPTRTFSVERFLANPQKSIVQVGWWLRRLRAIYRLPLARGNPLGYDKVWLLTTPFYNAQDHFQSLLAHEPNDIVQRYEENTRVVQHLGPLAYDACLSQNIAFMDLWDCAASTAVTECMARATPLLINPLPAVVEYLGADYPFYFSTLEEAAEKALDVDRVVRTHHYLENSDTRRQITGEHFLQAFQRSDVYQSLSP
jgi:tetratricopeptide (TPR) repeat protein